jgi:hypothetical protein
VALSRSPGGLPYRLRQWPGATDRNVAGLAAITEGADTVAGVGTVLVAGIAAITEGADTVTGVGAVNVAGIAAITEGADSVAGVGTVNVAGVAAITEGADSVAAAGTVSVSGIAAILEDFDSVVGVGDVPANGAAAIVEDIDIVAAVGSVPIVGADPLPIPRHDWQSLTKTEAAKVRRIERKLRKLRGELVREEAKPETPAVLAAIEQIEHRIEAVVLEARIAIDPVMLDEDDAVLLAIEEYERSILKALIGKLH